MLRELHVRDLALLVDERIEFGPGLNVITGKTGAGKSLVLSALALLLGGRFSREMLRTGTETIEVEGLFEVSDPESAAAARAAIGIEGDDLPLELVVRRRVEAGGRNRCEAERHLLTVSGLRDLGTHLVEIHGQSDHQSLLDRTHQTSLFDRAAGLTDDRLRFAESLAAWETTAGRVRSLSRGAAERAARLEYLEAIESEILGAELRPGEVDELRRERALLANAGRHAEDLARAIELVSGESSGGGDSDVECALDQVGRAVRHVEATADLAEEAREAQQALEEAFERLSDAARALEAATERVRTDPQRLEQVEDRIEELGQLLRRHGPSEDDALRVLAATTTELDDLRDTAGGGEGVRDKERKLAAETRRLGLALNAARRKAASAFEAAVRAALGELGMAETRFQVVVDDGDLDATLDKCATSMGLGELSFLASPNPGEDLKPLAKIASGGELARVALAIKGELAQADRVPLLVFDEIDADVGPRLGEVIGRRLAQLGRSRQVLVVTHLPQVAAAAAHHVLISKVVKKGRTTAHASVVTGAEREMEIAEMIRGEGRGKQALGQAKALIEEARQHAVGATAPGPTGAQGAVAQGPGAKGA